jgi:peptide/nickel transport system substrate-binding protein
VTSADLRWSFLERFREGPGADAGRAWRQVTAIETPDARRAVMRFAGPSPGAPAWLAHLGGFVVARHAMGRAVGTGPFRLVEHHAGVRLVLERNEAWWGPRPALRRVVVEVMPEAAARVAAVQAGRVDLAAGLPVREVARLGAVPGLETELSSLSRLVLLLVRDDGGFADRNVRLAAHHAIDKAALVQAFAHGVAVPLSLAAAPGSAGFDDDFLFPHDPNLAILLLEKAGHSLARPARVRLATTRGLFAGDYDMARAIVAMWRRVGIEAVLEVVDAARQMELARAGRLPEAALWSFDGGAEPETGLGALLDPELPFAPEADAVLARQAGVLAGVADAAARAEGWQALGRAAVEAGACLPLLQGVQALVRRQALSHRAYGNGWVLPQTMAWL